MANGVSEIVALAIGILLAHLSGTRWVPSVFCFIVSIVGGAMTLGVKDRVTQLAGYNLIYFFPVASALLYSWLSSAIGGTTKKIVFNVVLQLGYCAGNIVGPQAAGDAPEYHLGKVFMIIMFAISAFATVAISLTHHIWNVSRERAGEGKDEPALSELADHTDKELRSFRYPL